MYLGVRDPKLRVHCGEATSHDDVLISV
jgi:hypothetical protein